MSCSNKCCPNQCCSPNQCCCCIPCPCPPRQCPIAVNFPQQCRTIFPGPSCSCSGFVRNTSNVTVAFSTIPAAFGTGTVDSTICDLCNLAATTFNYQFVDILSTNSFSFTATLPQTPTCTITSLTLGGVGSLTFLGASTVNVPFSLTLSNSGGICTYSITLNTLGLIPGIPIITIGPIAVVCGTQLSITTCSGF